MTITAIELVQAQLRREIPGLVVVSKVPTKTPKLFVRVDQSAAYQQSLITGRSYATVQVYGADLEQVIDTADTASEALNDIALNDARALDWQRDTLPQEFPDPELSTMHRWQFTGQLIHLLYDQ